MIRCLSKSLASLLTAQSNGHRIFRTTTSPQKVGLWRATSAEPSWSRGMGQSPLLDGVRAQQRNLNQHQRQLPTFARTGLRGEHVHLKSDVTSHSHTLKKTRGVSTLCAWLARLSANTGFLMAPALSNLASGRQLTLLRTPHAMQNILRPRPCQCRPMLFLRKPHPMEQLCSRPLLGQLNLRMDKLL